MGGKIMVREIQAKLMAKALHKILGKPSSGTVAFIRCLDPEVVRALSTSPVFSLADWAIFGVVGSADKEHCLITADQAVEMREDKRDAVLLLVDVHEAGAGMDSIYSAAREIGEPELFGVANEEARKAIPHGFQVFAQRAVNKARRVGGHNTISPWREFEFYCCCTNTEEIGKTLPKVGLWPIQFDQKPNSDDLDKSVRMVERLFLQSRSNTTAESRVDALLLVEPAEAQRSDLVRIVRESAGLPLMDTVGRLADYPHLWLSNLNPGIFNQDMLQKIEVVSWRGKAKKPTAWAGLTLDEANDRLQWILDPNATGTKNQSRLEVRWKGLPDELAKGAVEYTVAIASGEEELAEKKVTHTGKNPQKCAFTLDDFELEEGAKFEAVVRIRAIGYDEIEELTEDFLLLFGNVPERAGSSVGHVVRALVEGAIMLDDREMFEAACSNPQSFGKDSKGFITFRHQKKNSKIFCPTLLRDIEEDWGSRKGAVGRWSIPVRADGSQAGGLTFEPLVADPSTAPFERLCKASTELSQMVVRGQGLLGTVHGFHKATEEYLIAWQLALDACEPSLALANTLEVRSLSGHTIGLIVLPHHPLRLAWHYAYDLLLPHFRYEGKIGFKKIQEIARSLDGAHFPAFLPGLRSGESFVFGDTLGFYAVAMVSDREREPKASIAILAKVLSSVKEDIAPSIGKTTSNVLAQEISRYLMLHPNYSIVHLHALRPGDGMTIGRSMGAALEQRNKALQEVDENEGIEKRTEISFVLELYPSAQKAGITGKFFSDIAERKRTGAGHLPEEDRWILENYNRNGKVTMPRLSWAKKGNQEPETAAHLSVAFDTFDSQVLAIDTNRVDLSTPIEAYGLSANLVRDFAFSPQPTWRTLLSQNAEGQKHPVRPVLSERITKIHTAIMKATAKNLGAAVDAWPLLKTEITPDKEESIRTLHKLSDWVITIDRNAGVEYFDSPREKPAIYEAYIIDCVPEREDLGFLQMVTSTSSFDEVVNLLDGTLAEMGLSSSPRNCLFLLNELKALSGRFAMRLAESGNRSQEMIALAMVHANCRDPLKNDPNWLSLKRGFFVPLDDVPDLLGNEKSSEEDDNSRADLLYVTAPKRGGLQFAFVEIKFRRYLKTARSLDLIRAITGQLQNSRRKWNTLYGDKASSFEKAVRRGWLAIVLKFYADKGRRHYLTEEAHQQIIKEIDRMVREGERYAFPAETDQIVSDRGHIFCPEYTAEMTSRVSYDGELQVLIFGAYQIPDSPAGASSSSRRQTEKDEMDAYQAVIERVDTTSTKTKQVIEQGSGIEQDGGKNINETTQTQRKPQEFIIKLGTEPSSQEPIEWKVSITSNPHLMIVGLPGMGKTTSLINICLQMVKFGISPIIFSYHDDIDEKLTTRLGDEIQLVDYAGLGFNPLQVVSDSPLGYIDNISMLRDIFASIFPDLGDIQLGKLREAMKQSYLDKGWEDRGVDRNSLTLPDFQSFYDILQANPKADKGLMTRLEELNDYRFFRNTTGAKSLLSTRKPALIRIHRTQNEVLQQAFSTFVLHNLYQQMFIRGVQRSITHAIIFDEAHRAAKLRLIPTMAKECRKYGIAFVLASQEAKDFDPSLFNAVANYLALRLNEGDAKVLAKIMTSSDQVSYYTNKIKQMPKYHALFFGEERNRAVYLGLDSY